MSHIKSISSIDLKDTYLGVPVRGGKVWGIFTLIYLLQLILIVKDNKRINSRGSMKGCITYNGKDKEGRIY